MISNCKTCQYYNHDRPAWDSIACAVQPAYSAMFDRLLGLVSEPLPIDPCVDFKQIREHYGTIHIDHCIRARESRYRELVDYCDREISRAAMVPTGEVRDRIRLGTERMRQARRNHMSISARGSVDMPASGDWHDSPYHEEMIQAGARVESFSETCPVDGLITAQVKYICGIATMEVEYR